MAPEGAVPSANRLPVNRFQQGTLPDLSVFNPNLLGDSGGGGGNSGPVTGVAPGGTAASSFPWSFDQPLPQGSPLNPNLLGPRPQQQQQPEDPFLQWLMSQSGGGGGGGYAGGGGAAPYYRGQDPFWRDLAEREQIFAEDQWSDQYGLDRDRFGFEKDQWGDQFGLQQDQFDWTKAMDTRDYALQVGDFQLAEQAQRSADHFEQMGLMTEQDMANARNRTNVATTGMGAAANMYGTDVGAQAQMFGDRLGAVANQDQNVSNLIQGMAGAQNQQGANQVNQFSAETQRAGTMGNLAQSQNEMLLEASSTPRDVMGAFFMGRGITPDWDSLAAGNPQQGDALVPQNALTAYEPSMQGEDIDLSNQFIGQGADQLDQMQGQGIQDIISRAGGPANMPDRPDMSQFQPGQSNTDITAPPQADNRLNMPAVDINPGGEQGGVPMANVQPGMNLSTVGSDTMGSNFDIPAFWDRAKTQPIQPGQEVPEDSRVWVQGPQEQGGGQNVQYGNDNRVFSTDQRMNFNNRSDDFSNYLREGIDSGRINGQQARDMRSDFQSQIAYMGNIEPNLNTGQMQPLGPAPITQADRQTDAFQRLQDEQRNWMNGQGQNQGGNPGRTPSEGNMFGNVTDAIGGQPQGQGNNDLAVRNFSRPIANPDQMMEPANFDNPSPVGPDEARRRWEAGQNRPPTESSRMNQGGMVNSVISMLGDASGRDPDKGGAKPEVMFNPTGAPFAVLSYDDIKGMLDGQQTQAQRFATGTGQDVSQQYAGSGLDQTYISESGNPHLEGQGNMPDWINTLNEYGAPVAPSLADAVTGQSVGQANMASAFGQRGGGTLPSLQSLNDMNEGEQELFQGYTEGPVGLRFQDVLDSIRGATENLGTAQRARGGGMMF